VGWHDIGVPGRGYAWSVCGTVRVRKYTNVWKARSVISAGSMLRNAPLGARCVRDRNRLTQRQSPATQGLDPSRWTRTLS